MNSFKEDLPSIILLFMFACTMLLPSCHGTTKAIYKKSKAIMDTFVAVTVVAGSEEEAVGAIEEAFSVLEQFGSHIDFFSEKSELTEINNKAGISEVRVSPDTFDVIEKAVFVSQKTEGAFDATIGPVIKLWDFHKKIKPQDEEIRKKLPLVGYRHIVLDRERSTVFLKEKGMLLDLGAIAKGYAADLAVATLKKRGITAGLVAAAGDIVTFGTRPDGKEWNVGIRNPRQKSGTDEIMAQVRLSGRAISTSGDYERYFESEGRRYHHLLAPKTGYPAGQCISASIVSDRGVYSDAFSTAVFVLGPEKGLKVLSEMGMDGIIVDTRGELHMTPGIKEILKLEKNH